jgi:hypothetical protein
MFIVTQPYSDALAQTSRLFAVLLVILASKDENEELLEARAAAFEAIKSSKARNPEELGSHIRSIVIFMANHVYEKNGVNPFIVSNWVAEINKRGTMDGLLELLR